MIRITKEFTLEMAHALEGYDGKCANIHGHSYHLSVTVIGKVDNSAHHSKTGMVMDFSDLKKIVQQEVIHLFDHALVLKETDPWGANFDDAHPKVIKTPYQPTSENIILDFAARISRSIPSGLKLHSLKLRETASSYVEWVAGDIQQIDFF